MRFTVRRMMAWVVVVAFVLGGERARRHWAFCQDMATLHATRGFLLTESNLPKSESVERYWREHPGYREGLMLHHWDGSAVTREKIKYEARMRQKYLRARWQPWRSVPPDPPSPSGRG